MPKTLAVIHTTPVTIGPLKNLASEFLPGYEVINFIDDSILPKLGRNGGEVREVEARLIQYAKYAEESGADIILNACSSVGEVVAKAEKQLTIPIVRIDEAMAEEAINRGNRIGVIATLSTTLNPTTRLLQEKAKEYSRKVEIEPILAEEAYKRLINGDQDGHDSLLADKLRELGNQNDVVVLAQASMARAVRKLPEEEQEKFLTSPELGMERVQRVAEGMEE